MTDSALCGCRDGVQCRLCQRGYSPRRVSLACVHEGAILESCTSCGVAAEGRHVRDCDLHDRCTRVALGGAIRGCNECPDFEPPPPPRVDPEPRGGERLLVTLCVGQDDLYASVSQTHRDYAARIGADHVVLRGSTGQRIPVYEKFRYRPFVAAYDRTLVLDTDTWVHRQCPDLFAEVPRDAIGMNRVDPWLPAEFDWRGQLRSLCASQGVPVPPAALERYWNCGVWVGSREHADYWLAPPRVDRLPGKWCDEEQWGRVQIANRGWRVHDLDKRLNYQFYLDQRFERLVATKPWIVHLAGFTGAEKKWRLPMLRLLQAYAA